jgi:hypothetical protein
VSTYGKRSGGGGSGGSGGNAWASARQPVLDALVSGLTYIQVKPSNIQPATVAGLPSVSTLDAAIVGGGWTPTAGNFITLTGVIYTDLTTQPHAWAVRGRFAAVSANLQLMGPCSNAGNDYVMLAVQTAYDATHLVMELFKAGGGSTKVLTSHVVDGNSHNYGVAFDGTTYKCLVDDLVVGSTTVLTNLNVGNRVFAGYNTTAGDVKIFDLLYGYQLP